ncbi:hypothetical protein DRV84_01900 [Rhodosalinus sediminis]|uniref:Uncharacterized protein n=1 Tax=Rhodosalinus sediminis TaxID=1940533 RepID=A0A3D9BXV2_9RHOB|nr:hypothetical protein [Rhodosalinus sediminis]REC58345.1 hypothetical protein DRV84_01900 [Rhodosalinus sediminis]
MRFRDTSGWRKVQGLWRDLTARRGAPRRPRAAAAPAPSRGDAEGGGDRLQLAQTAIRMADRDAVERHLPDILGRALARSWIDADFRARFTSDPVGTLAAYGIGLPPEIGIETGITETQRPRLIVYERARLGRRRRLLAVQLVLTAGR